MARKYSSTSTDTTLTATLGSGATSCTVADAVDLMGGVSLGASDTFTVAISPDTASEEIVLITNVSSNTLTITRAQAGTTAQNHDAGATVRHVLTSLELGEFATLADTQTLTNKTINLTSNTLTGTTAQFNTALSDGNFVTIAGTETLTNKTLTSPTLTTPTISSIVNTGTLTLPTSTDTLVGRATTDTLTNKTLTSPTINGATIATSNTRVAGVDEKTTGYTLVVGDASKLISVNSASNLTVTVPSGVFSVGDVIYVTRTGTGTVTIAASGTTLTSPDSNLKLRVRYSSAAIICTASNTFRVVGDLSA